MTLFYDIIIVIFSYYLPLLFFQNKYYYNNLYAINSLIFYIVIVFVVLYFTYLKNTFDDYLEFIINTVISQFILLLCFSVFSFWFRKFAVPRSVLIYAFAIQAVFISIIHKILWKEQKLQKASLKDVKCRKVILYRNSLYIQNIHIQNRVFDIMLAILAILFFSPVFLIVPFLILIDDGRPVFYLQNRVGLNGKIFKIIKFRTMIKDAEKHTGAILSKDDDSRITKIGKFLRKTGFDEVPQFINVLKGEMSIVGPRPERPELIEKIKKEVPDFELRLKVKPGITGLAQVIGRYDTPFGEKLAIDLYYINNRSLILDIFIILNTIKLFVTPYKRK